MKDKSKITLRGEAGRNEPDVEPGDVVFVLDCKPHKYFQRVNQVPQLFDTCTRYTHHADWVRSRAVLPTIIPWVEQTLGCSPFDSCWQTGRWLRIMARYGCEVGSRGVVADWHCISSCHFAFWSRAGFDVPEAGVAVGGAHRLRVHHPAPGQPDHPGAPRGCAAYGFTKTNIDLPVTPASAMSQHMEQLGQYACMCVCRICVCVSAKHRRSGVLTWRDLFGAATLLLTTAIEIEVNLT